MKKDGIFLFFISSSLPEIFKFSQLCKLGTDDLTRCVCGNQNTKSRISLESIGQCNGYILGIYIETHEIHRIVHNLVLLWQQSWFQSLSSLIPM